VKADLALLLHSQPVPEAGVVDELNSTPAQANVEEWVV